MARIDRARWQVRANIARFRELLEIPLDEFQRRQVNKLLIARSEAAQSLVIHAETIRKIRDMTSPAAARRGVSDPRVNRLLALLPRADYERLRPHLEFTALKYRQSLYRAHRTIGFVYFHRNRRRLAGEHDGERRCGRGGHDRQ
jgi:hypothetical protein